MDFEELKKLVVEFRKAEDMKDFYDTNDDWDRYWEAMKTLDEAVGFDCDSFYDKEMKEMKEGREGR